MIRIATHLVAFWDGQSNGAKHIIDLAREKGIPMWIFGYKKQTGVCTQQHLRIYSQMKHLLEEQ